MCRKGLSDAELEKLLYESSDSEVEDQIEEESCDTDNESDDSLSDPDYCPLEHEQEDLDTIVLSVLEDKNVDVCAPPTKKSRMVPPDFAALQQQRRIEFKNVVSRLFIEIITHFY